MIKIKSVVEIIYECDREDMSKDFQKMSLKDLQNYCLKKSKSSPLKEELESCLGDACKVRIKDVEVTEE